ncbi:Retrovirus-related Pol polyprotein from transposon TNT 1-94 [Glycine soja]|uniref:Retrovirus-related Pol polyprotein from transposon TNT 1-94 n=1 Tax=Glycine soja TaxID=3848 RepID=A0A445JVF2_GLYSO|nr:Retrovirus-related Pol polyprotein from transposon TNT 1-94 [Glycine soja]
MEFESDDDAYRFYNKYARLLGFNVTKDWINKSKVYGKVVCSKFTCSKEGYHSKDKRDANVKKHSKEKRSGCLPHMIVTRQSHGKYQLCILWKQLEKSLAVILGCMSFAILSAEATILTSGVDLSLLSILVHAGGQQEVLVQLTAVIPLMYMCICTYYSLFKMGMMMFYSLTPKQTSSVSLLMICSMIARYAAPISYNFLNLINLGGGRKTIFEQKMGKINDAVPFFGKEFNKIYPLIMVVYTSLIASNIFNRVIKYCGNWKIFKFNDDAEDMDGFNPSGVIILQRVNITSAANVTTQVNSIPMLNGTNFKVWKEAVEIVFGCMDLDLALRMERPISTPETSNEVKIEKWDRSNRMCLMIMKRSMPEVFRGSISKGQSAKKFLKEIEQYFTKNEKTEMSNLLAKLISMKYKGKGNIREYIMEMSNLESKLTSLKLELGEDMLVHLVLISPPAHFGQFKVSYNTQKDKWSLNELISHCVQEEERLQRDRTESTHLTSTSQNKKRKKTKGAVEGTSQQKKQNKDEEFTYYICKKAGHMKKECPKVACGADCQVMMKDSSLWVMARSSYNEILQISSHGTKRKLNENSATLWHKHLGHISKQRIQRLVLDEILDPLDLSDFEVCIECIKGKQTNIRKLGAKRAKDVLELVHTDICGPFPTTSWNGQQYFITFIDDYSRYGYLYLIHEKSHSVEVFKTFKTEVELQLGKKIKIVKSDRGGEYYDRYDGSGEQRPGPFALFLKECGIVSQYTMPSKPNMNDVAERRN